MSTVIYKAITAIDGILGQLADLADNPSIDYKQLVLTLSWANTAFEVYVISRQLPMYKITRPPPELINHLKQETHDKSQSYGKDKMIYSLAKTIYSQLLTTGLIYGGVYEGFWNQTGRLMTSMGMGQEWVIVHSLLWTTALTLLSAIPNLAWSYYYNFILEAKHGFNKSTFSLWVTDTIKTWLITMVIGLPFLAGFLKVIEVAGKFFIPALMLFMVTVQLVLQIAYPTFIQPLFNKFTPVPEGEVRSRVETLANKLGFPLKHLYVIDGSKRSSHSNAYFYGLPWSKQIVIYDTLIDKSTPGEVEAVLAHELGHWFFSHPTKLLIMTQWNLLFTLSIFSAFIHNKSLFASFGFDPKLAVESPQPIVIGFILYQLVFEGLDTLVQFLMHAQTRKYEYQADEFAVKHGKRAELGSALIKLHIDNLSSPHSDKLYSMYHHSHPTLPERLKAMEKDVKEKKKE